MRVLGCDPGFASFGWALVDVGPTSEVLVDLGVIRTEPSARRAGTLASGDHVRRMRQIGGALDAIEDEHGIVRAVCSEAYSQPRNAGSAVKLGFGWGVLVHWSDERPIVQASPQAVKLHAAGLKSASKEQVEAAIRRHWSAGGAMLDALPRTVREHAADAVAVVWACLDSEVIRMGRQA